MRTIKRIADWRPLTEEHDKDLEKVLTQYVALASNVAGLDVHGNDADLDRLMDALKRLSTSDKNMLKTKLKQWTRSRASKAVATARGSMKTHSPHSGG